MRSAADPAPAAPASQRQEAHSTGKSVRQARARLTQRGDIKPEFEYELLSMFVRNELAAVVTIPMLAIIIAMTSMYWAPADEVVIWLLTVLIVRSFLMTICRRFANTPRELIDIARWRRRLITAEIVYGCAWAGIAIVGRGSSDPSGHIFVFAALIVVLTLRLIFASTVLPIVYAGTLPITLALILRFAEQNSLQYWSMAAMALGVHIYFVFLAKGLNATVTAMFAFRAEKDGLIAELEEAKAISDEARRRAEADNTAKSRFLANMSHELRTPLNAILGFSEVMMTEMMGPIENRLYKEYCGHIHSSGKHLLHVINEILDLSRIEAGRHQLQEGAVTLTAVAQECHRLLQLRADTKTLRIVEEFEPGLPQVWADERALRQVVLNLMSNALKFTPQNGQITLRVASGPGNTQILSVKDTGPGIPKEEMPRVLQAFGQGSLAERSAEGGTGLGLSIVQSLIELHGGTFELRSELRRGTEAIMTLPSARVLQRIAPLQPLGAERHKRMPPPPAPMAPRPRAPRPAGISIRKAAVGAGTAAG
jgi:two-component system, cell cycle sensor histidine kinase PleC